ncbi:MAG TPA: hypothetical protein V6D07_13955 [Trichocoleus sp.]
MCYSTSLQNELQVLVVDSENFRNDASRPDSSDRPDCDVYWRMRSHPQSYGWILQTPVEAV